MEAKKSLGQHFLKNETAVARIINAVAVRAGETIIEIGPGTGALTKPLAATCAKYGAKLIAVEKDPELVKLLAGELASWNNVEIVSADVLRELPKLTDQLTNYKLVGNIPYYITGHLLRVISELPRKPLTTVVMVQREVAERVCAPTGAMNLLAVATQVWSIPETLFKLTPVDFDPPPAVHSAVMLLTTRREQVNEQALASYYEALKKIFKQPRKTLLNNLVDVPMERAAAATLIADQHLAPNARPQDLSVAQILAIATQLPR